MVIVRNGGPSRIDPAVNDLPDNTDPGPDAYDYPSESYRDPDHWHNVVDAEMVPATILNYAAGQDASCDIVVCGDRMLVTDLAAYGADAVGQVAAALAATVRDTAG